MMNAYELADKLQTIRKNIWYDIDHVVAKFVDETANESATMLRQQADQIAELEKEAEACWCQGHSEAYLKAKGRLPHPVKQLSDEEIIKVCKSEGFAGDLSLLISFAKAIIKEITNEAI